MRKYGLLLASLASAVLLASGVALFALGEPARAAFPGENGKIAFVSDRTTGEGADNPEGDLEIFAVNPDGTGIVQLTSNAVGDGQPAYSADGKRIVFTRDGDLYVMNADGSGQTQITDLPSVPFFHSPTWSPDGSKILFSSSDSGQFGQYDVYVINVDGSGLRNLTNTPTTYEFGPSWSPDGTRIAFARNNDVYVMNADGSNAENLTDGRLGDGATYSTDWSPDGSRIVFQFNCPFSDCYQVHVVQADGSGIGRLSEGQSPRWSPDGRKIVFFRTEAFWGTPAWIYVMNADGSEATRLTDSPWNSTSPSWQPLPANTGPTSKAECKNGGYEGLGFKSQGQCVKAVTRAR